MQEDASSQKEPAKFRRISARYAVFDEIARGGMGSVHLGFGECPDGKERLVAAKRAYATITQNPEYMAMLLDEARIASAFRHRNVVTAYETVQVDGELWLIMDYVHGVDLATLLGALPNACVVPWCIACSIAIDTLRGLHAAHEAQSASGAALNIVHRDVSPQNILVGRDGVARITDFGIAKAAGQLHRTGLGQLKGKLAYLAPERLHGAIPERRIDVFGAAIVLWEMLAGAQLFNGSSEAEVLAQAAAPKISSPRALQPDLPLELEAIVMRGLQVDPELRFQSAGDMADALQRCTEVATQSEVSAWVTLLASDDLAERDRHLDKLRDAFGFAPPLGELDALPIARAALLPQTSETRRDLPSNARVPASPRAVFRDSTLSAGTEPSPPSEPVLRAGTEPSTPSEPSRAATPVHFAVEFRRIAGQLAPIVGLLLLVLMCIMLVSLSGGPNAAAKRRSFAGPAVAAVGYAGGPSVTIAAKPASEALSAPGVRAAPLEAAEPSARPLPVSLPKRAGFGDSQARLRPSASVKLSPKPKPGLQEPPEYRF